MLLVLGNVPTPAAGRPRRHYSGVLLHLDPHRLEPALESIRATPGVELHQVDAPSARCVAVLESDDRAGQERLFRELQALPGVVAANLQVHWIDTEPGEPSSVEDLR